MCVPPTQSIGDASRREKNVNNCPIDVIQREHLPPPLHASTQLTQQLQEGLVEYICRPYAYDDAIQVSQQQHYSGRLLDTKIRVITYPACIFVLAKKMGASTPKHMHMLLHGATTGRHSLHQQVRRSWRTSRTKLASVGTVLAAASSSARILFWVTILMDLSSRQIPLYLCTPTTAGGSAVCVYQAAHR